MTYCLNPYCAEPQNPDEAQFCKTCGQALWLGKRFRALGVLGEGGFGRTYLAVDEANPNRAYCVIKQAISAGKIRQDAETVSRLFRQEADRLAQLGAHPQIPTLLSRAEQAGSQYLMQDYIDGRNLDEVLQEEGPFSELQLRRVLQDLLPVLHYIHSKQIIHRDIKPQNIIEPAQGGRLVLVDFGASKYATDTALARTGTVIGSAGYAAPEQAMGRAEFASDLYSLGVTCIHLLTGLHPFDLYSVSDDAWVWTQFLPKPVSAELVRVLNRMLQKPIRQRYSEAQAIARDLNLETAPVLVNAVSPKTGPTHQATASSNLVRQEAGAIAPPRYWQCVHQLTGHTGAITCAAISPDGKTLASGSTDRTVRLWNLQTGELQHTFTGRSLWLGTGHGERVNVLAFTGDGNTLASGSDDGTVKLWDLTTQRLLTTLTVGWSVTAIAAGGEYLVSGTGDGILTLWALESHEMICEIGKHRDQVSALILSADGQTLISSSHDKSICLWDLKTNRVITTLRDHTQPVSAIAISTNWQRLVSASWDRTLKIWDLTHLKLVRSITAHKSRIGCLAYSPDGGLLASSGEDHSIGIWAIATEPSGALTLSRLNNLRHDWTVNTLCFSPDNSLLISGGADETLQIWKALRGS